MTTGAGLKESKEYIDALISYLMNSKMVLNAEEEVYAIEYKNKTKNRIRYYLK